MKTYVRRVSSPAGVILLEAGAQGLVRVAFADGDCEGAAPEPACGEAACILEETERWLSEYFAGKPREKLPKLAPAPTRYQEEVRECALGILPGERISYGAFAKRMQEMTGRRTSARAVGRALGANPLLILVPCHRVCASDGSLRGYAGGLARKEWLLAHEGRMRCPEGESAAGEEGRE